MSKIYEALLRAEQDRAEQEKAGNDWSMPGRTAQVLEQDPVEEVAAAATEPAAPGVYTQVAAGTFAGAAAVSSSPADRATEPAPFPGPDLASPHGSSPARVPSPDSDFEPGRVAKYPWSPSLISLPALEDRGSAVEQFRSLRSRMFEFRDLNRLKSIMVSSGLPQEGKSFVAVNLAISFARHKAARVLLIDGDMRRSTLHKLLGASGQVGLAEYLAGNAGLLDIMQQIAPAADDTPARAGLASLTFIPGGSDIEKAADLSGNPRFAQLMHAVAPHFDWVVVDSAPVNLVADGVNLARACDGVLLVARGGVTKFAAAQRALAELKASKIMGFVLNAVEKLPLTGGYYGYESYDSTQQ